MYARQKTLQNFINVAHVLFQNQALPQAARELSCKVFRRLATESDDGKRNLTIYPACTYLDRALASVSAGDTPLACAARSVKELEPFIGWQRRTTGLNGSENYVEDHVNGMIVGPGGMESRYDVQLGFSLMAPNTRYSDHQHVPEEAYVLLTAGDFKQENGDWFDPGIGGGLYNRSNISHAMRTRDLPFFAFWCLLI
ncbi:MULTISPECIES: dimethylsulfonioproprionate lyase family protein [Paraburkholderia]|uniref:Transcriptional regulator n=1 Tax=Paraburkholderia podalyriae TaxID=1938811 RepID=A0ABR7PTC7_9BURK|nr:dimethylsulfonioproprionate lyase family protein [Paraburkholderia podalyriae]MBC8749513.1 transcriptional regulator [Paraburkholderia podalyriae]